MSKDRSEDLVILKSPPEDRRFVECKSLRDYQARTWFEPLSKRKLTMASIITTHEGEKKVPPPGLVCSARLGKVEVLL